MRFPFPCTASYLKAKCEWYFSAIVPKLSYSISFTTLLKPNDTFMSTPTKCKGIFPMSGIVWVCVCIWDAVCFSKDRTFCPSSCWNMTVILYIKGAQHDICQLLPVLERMQKHFCFSQCETLSQLKLISVGQGFTMLLAHIPTEFQVSWKLNLKNLIGASDSRLISTCAKTSPNTQQQEQRRESSIWGFWVCFAVFLICRCWRGDSGDQEEKIANFVKKIANAKKRGNERWIKQMERENYKFQARVISH